MATTVEYKNGFLPLVKLRRTFYDVNARTEYFWSPWDVPSRTKYIFIGIAFDWILTLFLIGMAQWFFSVPQPPMAYFRLDDETLKYPNTPERISANMATLINGVGPLIFELLFEIIFFWDRWNVYHLVAGHAQSLGISLFFTSLFWVTAGGYLGLRPTFLTKCQPDLTKVLPNVTYYDTSICTQSLAKFEFQGFPSGHSSTAFAGWMFFVMYINGKSKPWTGGAHLWKVLALLFPLYFASWISLTRVNDFHHFPFQIVLGALIGISAALMAYRLNFVTQGGWFFGPGELSDHIPAHYHWLSLLEGEKAATGGRYKDEVKQPFVEA